MGQFYLALESATKLCSVALFEDDQLIAKLEEGGSYSHAEKLATFVDQLLDQNQKSVSDLSAVAVSAGPGSYTGLRIGLSLAKGLCFAADLPLIAISTLEGMAAGAKKEIGDKDALYVPMIDARRMEVYTMSFDSQLQIREDLQAKIIGPEAYALELKEQKIYFFGDGAAKCREYIQSENSHFPGSTYLSASHWGELIHQKYLNDDFVDLAYFEPNYLKSFKAVRSKPLL